jgi:hypothetical protein
MTRLFLLGAWVSLSMVGCKSESASAPVAKADPAFDRQWTELARGGSEPVVIESDVHGAGLMGELRRAADSPAGSVLATDPLKGELPDDQVVRVIRSNLAGVKGCYQVAEKASAIGSGKAIMSVEIQPTGEVSSVRVDAPAFTASPLPGCMSERARSWTFPKFTQGPKRFSYPFVFVGG